MSIDWDAVRTRLRHSQEALERALTPDPERLAAIYRARAEQLAARRTSAVAPAATERYLTFLLGTEPYGIPFAEVAELLPFSRCTPVPGAPPALCAVMNVHGEVQSVIDLGLLLELPAYAATEGGYVLVLRHGDGAVALRVTQLVRVQQVATAEIATPGAGDVLSRSLRGIATDGLRLLRTDALLEHPLLHDGDL